MNKPKFFVEGKSDSRFLIDYVFHLRNIKMTETNFIKIEGCSFELLAEQKSFFDLNTDDKNKGTNILIFDANGDYKKKKAEILSWKEKLNIEFELFLFPNDSGNGNLETLLENISLPEHKIIFDCFDKYQDCIGIKSNYTLPNQKARIYAYAEAVLSKFQSEEIRDDRRNYLNTNLWKLDADYLNPLKKFIQQYL